MASKSGSAISTESGPNTLTSTSVRPSKASVSLALMTVSPEGVTISPSRRILFTKSRPSVTDLSAAATVLPTMGAFCGTL